MKEIDMLIINVEIWPGGDKAMSKEIARMEIRNISMLADNSMLADDSDYSYIISENPSSFSSGVFSQGTVGNHNRFQSVWRLIKKCLDASEI
jgi:hypothetical protein